MEFINNNNSNNNNNSTQVPITNSTKAPNTLGAAPPSNNSNTAAPNAKMGSRRIFPADFKVKVLDSYWTDNDCKGNQRATARKYGIHRRQIQKWLASEKMLREQLSNQNKSNVKPHQFHNVAYNSSKSPVNSVANSKMLSLGATRHIVATTLNPLTSSACTTTQTSAVATPTTNQHQPIRPIPTPYKSTQPHTPVTIVAPQLHYPLHPQLHHHHYYLPATTAAPTTVAVDEYYYYHHHQQQQHHQPQQQPQPAAQPHHPIDLSLARKTPQVQPPSKLSLKTINFNEEQTSTPANPPSQPQTPSAVDLTCRKRSSTSNSGSPTSEKIQKIKEEFVESEDEVDIEVDDGIDLKQPAKPIKLFKPYLLDEEEKPQSDDEKQQDPIIWSHSLTPSNRQCTSRSTTDSGCYPFPSGSPTFPSSPSSVGAFSPTAATCPKGSPVSVSGYESSSSSYSEYPSANYYSVDFKMNYPASSLPGDHVQRWLDHDARQGVAY